MRFYSNRLSSAIEVLQLASVITTITETNPKMEFVSPSIAGDAAVVSILNNCFHSSIHSLLTECLLYEGIVALKLDMKQLACFISRNRYYNKISL